MPSKKELEAKIESLDYVISSIRRDFELSLNDNLERSESLSDRPSEDRLFGAGYNAGQKFFIDIFERCLHAGEVYYESRIQGINDSKAFLKTLDL